MENTFEKLNSINVNDHVDRKDNLTYLSWSWAWAEVMKAYPETVYEIWKDAQNRPYLYDENLGYMVFTKVTLRGQTREMWLPVMDGSNRAMKAAPYTYKVKRYRNGRWTGEYDDRIVQAATMMDINKTIMRCLVKNLAMFGLGLYIYAGEDLPEEVKEEKPAEEKPAEQKPVEQKPAEEKPAEQAVTSIDSKPASKVMKKVIVDKCRDHRINLDAWLAQGGLQTIDQLTAAQAAQMIQCLKERYGDE